MIFLFLFFTFFSVSYNGLLLFSQPLKEILFIYTDARAQLLS